MYKMYGPKCPLNEVKVNWVSEENHSDDGNLSVFLLAEMYESTFDDSKYEAL